MAPPLVGQLPGEEKIWGSARRSVGRWYPLGDGALACRPVSAPSRSRFKARNKSRGGVRALLATALRKVLLLISFFAQFACFVVLHSSFAQACHRFEFALIVEVSTARCPSQLPDGMTIFRFFSEQFGCRNVGFNIARRRSQRATRWLSVSLSKHPPTTIAMKKSDSQSKRSKAGRTEKSAPSPRWPWTE